MQAVDLNLLTSLDVLLKECSVTRAARRLGLSASAMSRTLSRLRRATGDQLLVQAGRSLVLTPYAERLAARVDGLAREAQAVLQPIDRPLDLCALERTFTLRTNDGFVDQFGAPLVTAIAQAAPKVRVRFVSKPDKEAQPLREGAIDLEIGVLGTAAPELKTRLLFHARFVGVCRVGHPLLDKPRITAKRYAGYPHVVVSRKGQFAGPVDDALAAVGLRRSAVVVVPHHANAVQIVRHSDFLGMVPRPITGAAVGDGERVAGDLRYFELPVRTPTIDVSAIWHPRLHADPAHRWLRETILRVCRSALRWEQGRGP